jgi:hypothetical protein
MSEQTGYRYRYTAVMPEAAWARGRAPRERARKRQARADLIAGLDRYIRARSFLQVPQGAEATHEGAIALWIVWAAGLGADEHQRAPDGTEWLIATRWEAT